MPMNTADYHPDWKNISRQIREQAGWACEGTADFPDCRAVNRQRHPETGSIVILTVAHMNHVTADNDPANLRALCQRCHLAWDREHHMANARRSHARKRRGETMPLPLGGAERGE